MSWHIVATTASPVTDKGQDGSASADAIRKHNALIFSDPDFDAFIHPTRDGLIVARRKAR